MLKNNNGAVIARMARRSFTSNRRRTGILIAAIALSACMLFTILTVGVTWMQMQRRQNIRQLGGDMDAVLYGGFTQEQLESCQTSDELETIGVQGFGAWAVSTQYDSTLHTVFVWSDDTDWNTIMQPARSWVKGRYPQRENEVMATQEALADAGLEGLDVGDTFTMTYMDNNGEHTREFTISGMWDGYGDKQVFYVSRSFFDQSGFALSDYGRGFLNLKFRSPIVTQDMRDAVEQRLQLGKKQRFLVAADTAGSVQILLGLLGLLCITCLSAYLLIYNIMYLSVSGNVRYYGLLQTIGMTQKQVYALVQKQMRLIGMAGIGIGVLAGVGLSFGLIPAAVRTLGIRDDDIRIALHPAIVLLTVCIAALTVWIGSRKPAKLATRITPMQALGYRPQRRRKRTHKTGRGMLLWRMAREQLCRDKKKSALVIAALAVCLSFFLCMITLIQSQAARTIVSDNMNADLIISNDTMQMETKDKWKPLLDDAFLNRVAQTDGVREIHALVNAQIVVPWDAGFADYWMREFYDYWMEEDYDAIKTDYQQHPEQYASFVVGIDDTELTALNETLEQPVSEADFRAGKVCILFRNRLPLDKSKTIGASITFHADEPDARSCTMQIGGMTDDSYYANLLGGTPTLIVSDSVVRRIASNPYVGKLRVLYQEEYDEATEQVILQMIADSPYHNDFYDTSKIQAAQEVERSQGNLMEIGIGIALVLALIGMMNYLNASVGSIRSRQVELSVMESVGMTGKQVRQLLIREGLLYVGASLAVTFTLGLGVTYALFQSMNYRGVPFAIPALPVAAAVAGIALLCAVIPLAAYRSIEKSGSLVERIRGFE